MKFLVLGCNGMAGHLISLYLTENEHEVNGFAREKSKYVKTIVGDAFNTNLLAEIIKAGKYDAVVNCIGILNDNAENNKAKASFVNAYLPHFLVETTNNTETQIIHMSTDCVFSGKRGNYKEDDETDGVSFYDKSKALGEIIDDKNITLRTSIVGPDIKENGIGLFNWFMKQNKTVNGYTKSIWTGETTLQLAKTIEKAANERACGLVNVVPAESISKYELLKLFNKIRADKITVNPVNGVALDKSLLRTNFEFSYVIPDYEAMIDELSNWMKKHRNLYPHYNICL